MPVHTPRVSNWEHGGMQLVHITDPADSRLDDYRSLTDAALRRVREPASGLYIAESAKVIERALAAGHRARSVLAQEKWTTEAAELLAGTDAPIFVVPDDVAERLTGYAVHRGALAAMHRPVEPALGELLASARLVLVLEDIADPTNVGAAFRAAAALGADAVLVTPRCGDPLYRRSVRVSMGTVFQVPWTRIGRPSGMTPLWRSSALVSTAKFCPRLAAQPRVGSQITGSASLAVTPLTPRSMPSAELRAM